MLTRRQLSCKGENSGVSVLVEYILIIGILALVMAFIIPQLSNLMSKLPVSNAMKNQFQDVASEITSQITDMMLIAPKNGTIKSKVYMPLSVGKHTYSVEIKNNELEIKSSIWNEKVDLGHSTLGFITKGVTFSSEPNHEIVLNASTHLLPTAVAIVYPTYAIVGENVTFDMTHSFGEGTLSYMWIFGDGSNTSWKVYDPSNPQSGIVYHAYRVAGNYTAILVVKDSYGYTSRDSVIVHVTTVPVEKLYVNKYVVPATISPGSTSSINIFLYGNGINQTSLNITVIHTIDTSGSMNDFTPLNSIYSSISPNPSVVSFNLSSGKTYLVFVTTSDFSNFYFTYGVGPIAAFIKSPNSNYVQITDLLYYNGELGYGYIVRNPNSGTWYLAIDNGKITSETVNVYVLEVESSWFGYYVKNTVLSKTLTVQPTYGSFGIKVPEEATEFGVELIPAQTPATLYLWVKDNYTGETEFSIADSSPAWVNYSYPSLGYTAYVVPILPPNTTENFYLRTYIPKIDAAKIAAKTFNGFLRKYDYVGVVKFSGYYANYVVNPPTNDTNYVNQSIDALVANGATPMASGIEYAIDELQAFNNSKNSPAIDVIILLSDGNANIDLAGQYNVRKAVEDTIYEAYRAKDLGYIIYTIGYGNDANVTLLQQIADITGGKFYFAANAEELKSIYQSIAKDVLTKVAENVTVTDVVPPDIEVISAQGASIKETPNGTVVSWNIPAIRINQSWFGSITIKATKTGTLLTDVANVSNVTYFNVVTSKVVTIPLPVKKVNVTVVKSASFNLR